MSIRYVRQHSGYPGWSEVTAPLLITNGALSIADAVTGGVLYGTDDNGMNNIGAIIDPITPSTGIWYTFGGGDGVDPIVDTVGHYLATGETLTLTSKWEVDNIVMISDDAVDGCIVTITHLFPKPPTLTA